MFDRLDRERFVVPSGTLPTTDSVRPIPPAWFYFQIVDDYARPLQVSITANYRYRRGKISLGCSFFVRLALQGGWNACLSKNHHHYVLKFSSPQNNSKYSEIFPWMGRRRTSRVYGDFTSTCLDGESLLVDWFRWNSSFRSASSVSFWFSGIFDRE